MFVFYKPIKDGWWVKTISNYCKPIWNRCSEQGCIAWIKETCRGKIINFDYIKIPQEEINFWLYDFFWKVWDPEKEQYLDKQAFYFDWEKIVEGGSLVSDEDYKNWKFKKELKKINKWFDEEIEKYTTKYPIYEKMTWPIKQREAEIVANWWKSEYLENLVKDKLKTMDWYSEEEINNILQDKVKDFANLILQKAKEYAIMYSDLEAEKDKRIQELKL